MSSASSSGSPESGGSVAERLRRPIQVIVVSSVMFTFISYWRTAAVVLCDLASTAYYIGGIVEGAIGPAAPWFILAVMLFSYAVRSIYIESCSLFVRGGVYRVVKEAMGGFLAKLSVSALMFDYILTGPISAVSAGQYIIGLLLDTAVIMNPHFQITADASDYVRRWGSVAIAVVITLYFFRQNVKGLHESSGKALKIMIATTVMAVVILIWCGITIAMRGPANSHVPMAPDLSPKVAHEEVMAPDRITGVERSMWLRDPETQQLVPEKITDAQGHLVDKPQVNEATGEQEDPLGLISHWFPSLAAKLRQPGNWMSIIGLIGVLLAFGHSILAMSGEETLAQVYREVESPKLKNFKKAAFIVFVYSLALTASISFLAVLLIPDEIRMKEYSGNLIGGLAMYVIGPPIARLILNAFVVVIGFLILSGAVNTAIIGSNGVLNRVAEDGVMPDWFLKPHRRFGTTYRVLYLIIGLQLITILLSRGNMYVLGEAYAFGVVWSFVFKAMAMIVLRFKDRNPREFKVPFNIRIRGVEVPFGLITVFLILFFTALLNLLTKEVATIGGSAFTAVFLCIFMTSEYLHERRRGGGGPPSRRTIQSEDGRRGQPASPRPGQAVSEARGHSLDEQLIHARKDACGNRPRNDRRGRDDGPGRPSRRCVGWRPQPRRIRPAVDDRRGGPSGKGRQTCAAAHPPNQQSLVRRDPSRQRSQGPGSGPRGLERLWGRRADRTDRFLLDQPPWREPRAADDPHPQPESRSLLRPGRR